jgi:hypothetical protein
MNIFSKKNQSKLVTRQLDVDPMIINDTQNDMLNMNRQLTYLSVAANNRANSVVSSTASVTTSSAPRRRNRRHFKRHTYSTELISKILELILVQKENCSETARRVNRPVSSVRKIYQTYKGSFQAVKLKKPCNKMPTLSAVDLQELILKQEETLNKNPIPEDIELSECELDI